MLIVLTGQVAKVQVLPATLQQIFKLASRRNELQVIFQGAPLVHIKDYLLRLSKNIRITLE
jgi:hypothetical protein